MPETLAFDRLVNELHHVLESLPDDRKGKNTQDAIKDAALGAFAVFLTQCPSFLAYQRTMPHTKGRSHAETLFGMDAIPGDNQIRTWLDPVEPRAVFPVFETIFAALQAGGSVASFRAFAGQFLIA